MTAQEAAARKIRVKFYFVAIVVIAAGLYLGRMSAYLAIAVTTTLQENKVFIMPASSSSTSDGNSRTNTTLVILIGNLRCGEPAWQTLYNNVLDVNNADLALMIGDISEQYQNSSLFQRVKYTWRFQEYDDWGDALDIINGTAWRNTISLSPRAIENGALGGVKGYAKRGSNAISMMIKYWLAGHIRKEKLTQLYDRFVITRSDHFYMCPYNLSQLDNDYIWVPKGEDYYGICDRLYVSSSEHVLDSLDIITPFLSNYDPWAYASAHNAESMLKASWYRKNLPVKRSTRVMFICTAGSSDHTRTVIGKPLKFLPDAGVYVKKQLEYTASTENCKHAVMAP
jgi:hypothetical protein